MIKLSELEFGVAYRQRIKTVDEKTHSNFYLMRANVVECGRGHQTEEGFYLFTIKEILTAITRYQNDVGYVSVVDHGAMVGYIYPVTYHNCKDVLTVRHLFVFETQNLPVDKNVGFMSGLFSPREMARAQKRVDMYIRPSVFKRMTNFVKHLVSAKSDQ